MVKNEWESAEHFPVILIALKFFSSVHIFVSNGMTPLGLHNNQPLAIA